MNLYILEKRPESPRWDPAYDKAHGFVVRARSEESARKMAASSNNVGDEGQDAWLDPAHTTCETLTSEGEAEIVLCDFYAA
jgi:hypothetical protein